MVAIRTGSEAHTALEVGGGGAQSPAQRPGEHPAQRPGEHPGERPAQRPGEHPAQRPAQHAAQGLADHRGAADGQAGLDELAAVTAALAGADLTALGDTALLDETAGLDALVSRLEAERARRLRAVERRQAHTAVGCVTTASWLAWISRRTPAQAAGVAATARRTGVLDALRSAWERGTIRTWHADAICRAARPHRQRAIAENEQTLVELAERASPRELRRATALIAEQVDPDGSTPRATPDTDETGRAIDRELSLSRTWQGLGVLRATLDPVTADRLEALLAAYDAPDDPAPAGAPCANGPAPPGAQDANSPTPPGAQDANSPAPPGAQDASSPAPPGAQDASSPASLGAGGADAPAPHGAHAEPDDGVFPTVQRRTRLQRRHDALDRALAAAEEHPSPPQVHGARPRVLLTIDLCTLLGREDLATRRTRLGSGAELDLTRALALLEQASLTTVLMLGPYRPVGVGRTHRTLPDWLRPLLAAIHGHCRGPGCDRPLDWCQAAHLEPWHAGGETDLLETIPACLGHHELMDRLGWQVTFDPDTAICTWISPDGEITVRTHPPEP